MKFIQADQYIFGSFGSKGYHVPTCSAGATSSIRQIDEKYKFFGDPQPHPEIREHFFAAPLQPNSGKMVIGTFSMTGVDNLNRRDALVSMGILIDSHQYMKIGANPFLLFPALKLEGVVELAQTPLGELPMVELSIEQGWILAELKRTIGNLSDSELELLYSMVKSLWLHGKIRLPLNSKNSEILRLAVSITPVYLRQQLSLTTYSRLLSETLYFDVTLSVNKPFLLDKKLVFPKYFDSRLDEVLDYIRYNNSAGFEHFLHLTDLKPIPQPSKIKRFIGKINPFAGSKRK